MKAFIVYWHPEPQSFNAAMFRAAHETLTDAGHEVRTSDLDAMHFDPVSSRKNFTTIKDPDYFKPQIEEMYASEMGGFSMESSRDRQSRVVRSDDLAVSSLVVRVAGGAQGLGRSCVCHGAHLWRRPDLPVGRLSRKAGTAIVDDGGPEDAYRKGAFNGDITGILRPIHRGMLQFVGFEVLATADRLRTRS